MVTSTLAKNEMAQTLSARAEEAKQYWRNRNIAWMRTRAMLLRAYHAPKEDGMQWVFSNEPRTLTSLAIAIIAGKPPRWRMPMPNDDPAQVVKKGSAERLAEGAYRHVSRNWRRRGHGSWLNELVWYIINGGYAVFPHYTQDEDGEGRFECPVWDPMEVYPVTGATGMEALYRVYTTERHLALSMARANGWDEDEIQRIEERGMLRRRVPGEADPQDVVEIHNCFFMDGKDVVNGVVIDGFLVKEPDADPQFRRIPILAGPANGMPFRDYENRESTFPMVTDWREHWGEALIETNRPMYELMDRLLTYKMEIARKHALPTYEDLNEQGTLRVDPRADLGRLKAIAGRPSETFRPIPPPVSPKEADDMLQYLVGSVQRGGLSHVAFGSLGMDISGVTLQQLLTSTRSVLLPYIDTAQDVLSEIAVEWLDQFQRANGSIQLDVRARTNGSGMQYMIEDFTPDKLPRVRYFDVQLPLALPDDRMERITAARQAWGGDAPMLDPVTILDDILKVDDPEVIFQRINEYEARQSPEVKALEKIVGLMNNAKRLEAQGRTVQAQLLEDIANAMLQQLAGAIAGQGGGANTEGTPRTAAEPAPSVMPPEAGPMNPDRANMVMNRPATTPARPPSMDDRMRNMGLVPPREA